jgi:hypothetical protein
MVSPFFRAGLSKCFCDFLHYSFDSDFITDGSSQGSSQFFRLPPLFWVCLGTAKDRLKISDFSFQ